MGMEFPEPPDMEMMADEKRKAEEGKNKVINEDECWQHLFFIQKYEPNEKDDGLREVCKNTMTGKFRLKKRADTYYQHAPSRNSEVIFDWVWDGDAYNVEV